MVEQPLRSLAWHTSWLAPHVRKGVMNETHFCAFGGQRLKRTGLLSDRQLPVWFANVPGITPISHGEEPCERVAAFCLAEAEARGFQPVPVSLALPGSSADFGFLRTQLLASLGQQRRGLQAAAVPSAYKAVVTAVDAVGTTRPGSKVQHASLPKGTVLAHVQPNDDTHVVLVPKSPDIFMYEVKAATHPAAAAAPVPADVRQAIHEQTAQQPASIARHWANRLKSLLERAKELHPSELAALAETDAILQQVNSGVLLMSEILSSIQYPDLEVCEDLRHGRSRLKPSTSWRCPYEHHCWGDSAPRTMMKWRHA